MKKYSINKNNTSYWKSDIQQSVLFYNEWFLNFAPKTYINAKQEAFNRIETIFSKTDFFNSISCELLKTVPESITILRMSTTPPLARERLAGLADVQKSFIISMEQGRLPRINEIEREKCLKRIIDIINRLFDTNIMPWLKDKSFPHEIDRLLAKNVIGDRLCDSLSDPIIRSEQ
ncbi:MAG: XamI family restriction endonuclease [Bacteroidales bacterium]|nr:XamI family restriction endonuclease [Bacteroidales bacterium]